MKNKLKIFISVASGIILFYTLGYIADYIFPLFANKGNSYLLNMINLLLPVVFIIFGSILGARIVYRNLPSKK